MKTLLVTNDFPPVTSGISTVFYYVWRYLSAEKNIILAPRVNDSLAFDKRNSLHVVRYPFFTSSHTLVKVINNLCMLLSIGIFIPRVDAIHCGQILSSGICGLMFKKLVRTPYFLWVYGGETTSVYTKSSSKRLLVKKIIDSADIIVTNSKFTSREFLEYGIPEEKIIEIIPAVDSDMFVPLPKPADLMEKHKLHG
ncbi:MAG: glycosyltransferase family 4 protein, partial [Planctomycetes bacterium]|nr:glycosyltransferase family 4 protein [Planctomycetota bacterium]